MKIKAFTYIVLGVATAIFSLTSCSDDEHYDIHGLKDNFAFLDRPNTVTDGTVLKTPVGVFASLSGTISGKTSLAVNKTTTLTVGIDNSLVDTYNTDNSTHYAQIPDGIVTMDKTTLTIPSGSMASEDTISLSIDSKAAEALSDTAGYILPVVITSVSGDAQTSSVAAVRYIHINYKTTTSLINDDATEFAGTLGDLSQMTCIAATNLDPDGLSGLVGGGWRARWSFTSDDASASFVIDMGGMHNLVGFYIGSYVMKNAKVSISTDNQIWTEVSDTKGHKALQEYDYTTWQSKNEYVLYAPLLARYFKAELELDNTSRYWNYYKYISGLSLYFQD